MKLSEILWWDNEKDVRCACDGFNTALTSCDREIDREALAKAMYELEEKYLFGEKGETWERALNDVYRKGQVIIFRKKAQDIISTMPTWLKRSEK